ncbi:MAG: Holliday junction resolvase RuvX [Bacteroidales bacterium]|nr:Holliday junction resolvase RuvX [Bacteroidales bacterium]
MDRIIGIDYGKVRTGVAVSDPLGIFASPLDTVPTANIIDYLQKYVLSGERITRFVVGYPLELNGRPAGNAAGVDAFLKRIGAAFDGVPVTLEDERFTSVLAHRAMIDGGMKYSRRRDKSSVDRISAALILQGYLDRTKGND